jgi:hypothetical protein
LNSRRSLIIACGALATELKAIVEANRFQGIDIEHLPSSLHNSPDLIPAAVERKLVVAVKNYDHVLIGYADCGTGGRLDEVCRRFGVERLPGAHCYELYAGKSVFAALAEEEPGTFYLTDYLAKHFQRLVVEGLKLREHSMLRPLIFNNYKRVLYLPQTCDELIRQKAVSAAQFLQLPLTVRPASYGDLSVRINHFSNSHLEPSARRGDSD